MIGQNGLIEKAKQAKELYEKSAKAENTAMGEVVNKMEQYNEGDSTKPGAGNTVEKPDNEGDSTKPRAGDTVAKPESWTSTQVTPISDGNGGTVPLPNGFHYVVGGDYNTGLVISDKENDRMDASGVNMGNQFVWIPVASYADLERTLFDTTTGQPKPGLFTDCTEPYKDGYSTEENEYNTMRDQVLKYGGFYIGRYETSLSNATLTESKDGNIQSKPGVMPTSAGNSATSSWYGLYSKQKEYTGKNGSVGSSMIWGSQYDAMINWAKSGADKDKIANTSLGNNSSGSVTTTGNSNYSNDCINNIRDLGGNLFECTLEAYSTYLRVSRGGYFSNTYSPSCRGNSGPSSTYSSYGSRFTLYIK